MTQESMESERMIHPLVAGLSICMTCLLLLVGFKLRWFRARLTMGQPPDREQQRPAFMAGTYRRTFDTDSVPPILQTRSIQESSLHRSMPDLTPKASKQNGTVNGFLPQTVEEHPDQPTITVSQKSKAAEILQTSTPKQTEIQTEARQAIKVHNSPSPSAKNKKPKSKTWEGASHAQDEHLLMPTPKLVTPLTSRSPSPIMFGEAPLNHRADRLESLYMSPEVGVPFARVNALPSWAQKEISNSSNLSESDSQGSDTESTDTYKAEDVSKTTKHHEKISQSVPNFHEYDEFDS
ncbi:uncharacterized protein [Anabrus simplex]|uniref:uncharacterized protein n=1 Tax=Anabrus simplex TaxID=316456 RepID=UPI0035A29DD7